MSIVLEIRSEVEAEIARKATLKGSATEAYAASLLEAAMPLPLTEMQTFTPTGAKSAAASIASCAKASPSEASRFAK